jgi:CRP-like cAMP-binding protein
MLFPGSRIWYEGAVADLAALAEEIRTSRLSGHIVLEFADAPAIVVCSRGAVAKVFEKIEGRFRETRDLRGIWDRSRAEQGRLTVFEMAPRLAQRLRGGIRDRRVLCSGTPGSGCDPLRLLRELKGRSFTGILDAESTEGKLLLDFESGAVVACYAIGAAGPALAGLEAFRSWHEGFVRADVPTTFSVARICAPGDGQQWDEILMAGADRLRLPLPTSTDRLAQRYGRTAAAGALLFEPGANPGTAFFLISGEVELIPDGRSGAAARRRLTPGALVGVAWLARLAPARFSGRAVSESRYLAFGRDELATVFANSPALAARVTRASALLVARTRTRLEAYRAEPRLHDAETAVVAALERARRDSPDGLPEAELLAELALDPALAPARVDALLRKLVALGIISQSAGRVALTLREL